MLNFLHKKTTLVTHDGSFHADDVFACATLQLWLQQQGKGWRIVRAEKNFSPEKYSELNGIVFDVGRIYDHHQRRYDHHQPEGAGVRDNGIPYAAFGLIWKHYGLQVCQGNQQTWQEIDRRIVQDIDAHDNGVEIFTPSSYNGQMPYTVGHVVHALIPIMKDTDDRDIFFQKAVDVARTILSHEIEKILQKNLLSEHAVELYRNQQEPQILIWDKPIARYIVQEALPLEKIPNTLYVVFPTRDPHQWSGIAVIKKEGSYENRKSFPISWRGLSGDQLAAITGVSDALFCHRTGFLVHAASKEGIMTLAQKALVS